MPDHLRNATCSKIHSRRGLMRNLHLVKQRCVIVALIALHSSRSSSHTEVLFQVSRAPSIQAVPRLLSVRFCSHVYCLHLLPKRPLFGEQSSWPSLLSLPPQVDRWGLFALASCPLAFFPVLFWMS
jgi:hypothetical protein